MASVFESQALSAINAHHMPGLAATATNASGTFSYGYHIGQTPAGKQVDLDSPMYIASMTKLTTTIAALQLVEQGSLSLDAPISETLPEFKDLKVITGFNHKQVPVLVTPSPAPTLRHLLSHTSGFVYPGWGMQANVDKYFQTQERNPSDFSVRNVYMAPLAFHPGTLWGYGPSIDMAGLLVSAVSGLSLQQYYEQNIVAPLGLTSTAFANHLHSYPDIKTRLLDPAERVGESSLKPGHMPDFVANSPDEHGGAGLISSVADFVRILQALLIPGQLLGKAMLKEMRTPQLGDWARATYMAGSSGQEVRYTRGIGVGGLVEKTWGLGGGLIMEDDQQSGKTKGTMVWSGMPNLQWFVDPEAELVGVFGTQLLPTDDAIAGPLGGQFENSVRLEYKKWKEVHGDK